jgi:glycosyltransferase involved in cell wall biosynthesis
MSANESEARGNGSDERSAPPLRQGSPLFSVVIPTYNYGRYLRQCIQSVLDQTYPCIEIIVVDDGSQDNSSLVASAFGDRLTLIAKENGGQISSMNEGFKRSTGEFVMFLDADDWLLEEALLLHARALRDTSVVHSQGYLQVVNGHGTPTGARSPSRPTEEKGLRELSLRYGPGAYRCPPTSGNAWRRSFLEKVFPLPAFRSVGGDALLFDAAPFYGDTVTVASPSCVAAYRIHGMNMTKDKTAFSADVVAAVLQGLEKRFARMASIARTQGYDVSSAQWRRRNWRLQTLEHLHGRLSGEAAPSSFLMQTKAIFASRANPVKRVVLLVILAMMRLSPTWLSVRLARRIIDLQTL